MSILGVVLCRAGLYIITLWTGRLFLVAVEKADIRNRVVLTAEEGGKVDGRVGGSLRMSGVQNSGGGVASILGEWGVIDCGW